MPIQNKQKKTATDAGSFWVRISRLRPHSLRAHYLAVMIVLACSILLGTTWSDLLLQTATGSATANLAARDHVEALTQSVRNAVWDANFALERYLTSPNDTAETRVHTALDQAIARSRELSRSHWIRDGGYAELAENLQHDINTVRSKLVALMKLRAQPAVLNPALQMMTDRMLPANERFANEAVLAREDTLTTGDTDSLQHYLVFDRVHDVWSQMIGTFRVMVANRFGAFADPKAGVRVQATNVELLYSQLHADLKRLQAWDHQGQLSFQASESLREMLDLAQQWLEGFHSVRALFLSDGWRTDLTFLSDQVQPLFAQIWSNLVALQEAVRRSSSRDLQVVAVTGSRLQNLEWGLSIAIVGLILLGYAALERTILRPVSRLTETLWARAKDPDTQDTQDAIPPSGTLEMRRLGEAFQQLQDKVEARQLALEHQSMHDALTGLPNRTLLQQRLRKAAGSTEELGEGALLIMDLNHFKEINDTLGHPVGDAILRQVAERLQICLTRNDTVARLGGDEFAVVLPSVDRQESERVATNLAAALDREFDVGGHRLYVGASFGIALYPEHGTEVSAIMRCADVAMYAAKRSGTPCAVYNHQHDNHCVSQLDLIQDLRDAIADSTLELYYQPQQDLASGEIAGVEALLRWSHPRHGTVSPDRIIPVAERTGLIRPLTEWVLNKALAQLEGWREEGRTLQIAVNLSMYDLQDAHLPAQVRAGLARWNVPAAALELEITESAMMADPERTLSVLGKLDQMGVRLAIDDFGTGFSSLAYLKRLPVSRLKIDKSFVLHMSADGDDATIVRSTIELAHNLGIEVLAEGVEDSQTADQLRALRCDRIQGYHLCKPIPAVELADWLDTMNPVPRKRAGT